MTQILDDIVITQEKNDLVRIATKDPNPIHDAEHMASLGQKPIVLGTLIESITISRLRNSILPGSLLTSWETKFKLPLYVGEVLSTSYEFSEQQSGLLRCKLNLRSGERDIASVALDFSPQLQVILQPYNPENHFEYSVGEDDMQNFSDAICDVLPLAEFVVASRSGVIASAIKNISYPNLEKLFENKFIPVYRRHNVTLTGDIYKVGIGDTILANLTVQSDIKQGRSIVTPSLVGYNSAGVPLYSSKSTILVFPKDENGKID